MTMDDPSLLDLLIKHHQGIGGSMALSAFFSATYAIGSEFGLKKGAQAIFIGCVFSGAGWFFFAEFWHLAVYFVVVVALGGAYLPFPLIRAYIRRQDKLADRLLDKAEKKTGVD
jgi:hypothetical protein